MTRNGLQRTSIVGLTTEQIGQLPALSAEPRYRARQIATWVYQKGVTSFEEMTNLPKALRHRLAEEVTLERPKVERVLESPDGSARKILHRLHDGLAIESVLLKEAKHWTVCISSQVGCALGCQFCATAAMGLRRNLTVHEIVSQVLTAKMMLKGSYRADSLNVVFMGMGEPLANTEAVIAAISVLTEDHGLAVGRRRITVSTAGIPRGMEQLASSPRPVRLALSLNATTDEQRSRLMPINRRYGMAEVLQAVARYGRRTKFQPTLEYVLIGNVNDSEQDARRLARIASNFYFKVNVIVYNPHEASPFERPSAKRIQSFLETVMKRAPTVTLRDSKGTEIQAACGQLYLADMQQYERG